LFGKKRSNRRRKMPLRTRGRLRLKRREAKE
jgi:hypothetical protein